ncbi:MAG: Myo-inositol 2-dehydrogenase [Modestobacter sp.]|nr:Myo-inositol 2-dehydrogenase [Modestobacter sp.]
MGRVHTQAYARVGHHFPELALAPELVAVADDVPGRAEAAAGQFGFASATRDWRELVTEPRVGAVSITAPNFLHREIAVFLGGVASTAGLTGSLFTLLAGYPDQRALLRRDPSLAPAAVEETIRHSSPLQLVGRTTAREVTARDDHPGRCPGRAGLRRRQPRRAAVPGPRRLRSDPRRPRPAPRVRRGPARLSRRPLARLEAKVALEEALPVLGGYSLAGPPVRYATTARRSAAGCRAPGWSPWPIRRRAPPPGWPGPSAQPGPTPTRRGCGRTRRRTPWSSRPRPGRTPNSSSPVSPQPPRASTSSARSRWRSCSPTPTARSTPHAAPAWCCRSASTGGSRRTGGPRRCSRTAAAVEVFADRRCAGGAGVARSGAAGHRRGRGALRQRR